MKLLEFESIWMLRELDGNPQHQFVFIAFLGTLMPRGSGLNKSLSGLTLNTHDEVNTDPNAET